MSVLAVQNFAGAALNVAATTLRSVVGDMPLDDVLSKREEMNALLRVRLDEVTERWGVKVTNVEVREVNPPAGVLEAMTRQMSAERTRRAAITEAEGQKQAAITLAEGNRAGGDPRCGGRTSIGHSPGRGPGGRIGEDLDRRKRSRCNHTAAAVPRDSEGRRHRAIDQDCGSHGTGWVGERDSGPTALAGIERK